MGKYDSGRFAYQPLSEEFAKQSQTGQLIMSRFNGHISSNRNGIIVSKTKEIEDKIEDINEFRHDVDEQTDVITNLIEDLDKFIKNNFDKVVEFQNEVYDYALRLAEIVEYLDITNKAMTKKLDRIREIIQELRRANDYQINWLDKWEVEADNILADIGDANYVDNEFNNIMSLKQIYT